ncbi:cytochrome P450 [Mycena capillaripes]|nr:cytochrome P450 [Mycena capillaripes]
MNYEYNPNGKMGDDSHPPPLMSTTGIFGVFIVTVALAAWAVRRSSSRNITHLPGPKSTSWVYGHMPELLLSEEYGTHEFRWQATYGPVYSMRGCFGESRLMISDPLALKYVINNPVFHLGPSLAKAMNFLIGHGNVLVAQGSSHRHLRNIMNPLFSSKSVRAMVPTIKENARRLVELWESRGFPGNTVDISHTITDAIQDVGGEAILEYSFNSLVGQSELSKVQRTIVDSASNLTKGSQIVDAALPYIPDFVFRWAWRLPLPGMGLIQKYHRETDQLGRRLVQRKRGGEGGAIEDTLVGRLIRWSNDSTVGVPDEEIPVHLRTILFATQDTSGRALDWILYKLAQMPDFQQELRTEIQLASANGTDDLDYDNMPLLNAIINEGLRLYSPLPLAERIATEDCVLPLSDPIRTSDGVHISELPIKKGQRFYIAIASYHRLTSVWGPDAGEFRPRRWLEKDPCKGPALGPHASLLSFLGGPAVCLGWRFAILELQVFVTELVRNFVLTVPENDSVRPVVALTLVPQTAEGVRGLTLHVEAVM